MDDLARACAFEDALRERSVDRIEPLPYGHAVLTPSLPRVWDMNSLRVESGDGMTAERLAAEADRLQGGAGFAHRRVVLLDDAVGAALADGFAALGWRPDRWVYMVRRRPPERDPDLTRVEEVDAEALYAIREAIVRAEPWAKDDETVAQVLEGGRRVARAGNARHFAVVVDGEVVAATDLYTDGETAQVEEVATLPDHRGRGYASAVVTRAVAEADATGHDFVFLIADDEDWPKHLYRRLGFDEVGRKRAFLKPPLGARASA